MYDRLRATVIFSIGRDVQTGESLGHLPSTQKNQNKNICAQPFLYPGVKRTHAQVTLQSYSKLRFNLGM